MWRASVQVDRIHVQRPAHLARIRRGIQRGHHRVERACRSRRWAADSSSCARWQPARRGIGAGIGPSRHVDLATMPSMRPSRHVQELHRRIGVLRFRAQHRQVRERREAGRLAQREFALGEGGVAAVEQDLQQRMLGMMRLQQHLAGRSARPARPATCTSSCASFSPARKSAENRPSSMPTTTTSVRSRQVVALGQHLRADQDAGLRRRVRRSASQARRDGRCCRGRCAARGMSGNAPRSASSMRSVPMPCGCRPRLAQSGQASGAARVRRSGGRCRRRPSRVHGHRRDCPACAARALRAPAAVVAEQHRRVAAAVAEHQHLLAARPGSRAIAASASSPRPACSGRLRTSSTRTRGGLRVAGALAQAQVRVAAGLRVVQRFQRRRGAAQQHRHAERARAHQRDVARVVADAVLLLVAAVVFLVDHDQAGVRQRREHRRARADQHARLRRARIAAQARARSPSASPECSACTGTPRRARKRASVCGVRPISGTSTSACLPRARQSAIACR